MGLFDPINSVYPLTGLGCASPVQTLLGSGLVRPQTKRRVYFAFDFDDVMRVNNVRNAWKIDHPDDTIFRSFYDSSLWGSRKLESDEALKRLMREGVEHTSAVCVLVGSDTWKSRWVKYEIARAVIDERGLLAIHINGLNHHCRRQADALGLNPLRLLGVGPTARGVYHLFELRYVKTNQLLLSGEWQWHRYQDYVQSVPWPKYLNRPEIGWVMPLASTTAEHDFVAEAGCYRIGAWVDAAAIQAGR